MPENMVPQYACQQYVDAINQRINQLKERHSRASTDKDWDYATQIYGEIQGLQHALHQFEKSTWQYIFLKGVSA